MKKYILASMNGITFDIDTQHQHSIDKAHPKPFYTYAFTPYAALDNSAFSYQEKTSLEIGTTESIALRFKRKEARINLLQILQPGHENSEDTFLSFSATRQGAATVFNTNTLFWNMASDISGTNKDILAAKDFPSFLEKTVHIEREIAWRLAWAFVRSSYLEKWPSIRNLHDLALKAAQEKGSAKKWSKELFIQNLDNEITNLKKDIVL